jgi:hypothetical protein
MSDEEMQPTRWTVHPEPTPAELVSIISVMETTIEAEQPADITSESRWSSTARREQMRTSLDDSENGWIG